LRVPPGGTKAGQWESAGSREHATWCSAGWRANRSQATKGVARPESSSSSTGVRKKEVRRLHGVGAEGPGGEGDVEVEVGEDVDEGGDAEENEDVVLVLQCRSVWIGDDGHGGNDFRVRLQRRSWRGEVFARGRGHGHSAGRTRGGSRQQARRTEGE